MFIDKLGDIEIYGRLKECHNKITQPIPSTQRKRKHLRKKHTQLQVNSSRQIEENPRLSTIDAILKVRIKTVEGFVCYLMQKR